MGAYRGSYADEADEGVDHVVGAFHAVLAFRELHGASDHQTSEQTTRSTHKDGHRNRDDDVSKRGTTQPRLCAKSAPVESRIYSQLATDRNDRSDGGSGGRGGIDDAELFG